MRLDKCIDDLTLAAVAGGFDKQKADHLEVREACREARVVRGCDGRWWTSSIS